MKKEAIVLGAGGFIAHHALRRLKKDGWWVRGVSTHAPQWSTSPADEFVTGDLKDPAFCASVFDRPFDRVYQLAAHMGGAGFTFSGDNDAAIMHDSGLINLNVALYASQSHVKGLFYASSACVYPSLNRPDPLNPSYAESSAYPADPDSEYGWEKIFSERLYGAYMRNKGLPVWIGRLHTIYGTEGAWEGGREKFPAALCRKVAEAPDGGEIEIWGDGQQTRSFTYVDDCVEGIERLFSSDFTGPVNIGSDELISINDLAQMVITLSGKNLTIKNVPGPQGPRGRNSDNTLIKEKLGWAPSLSLQEGMRILYPWIADQVQRRKNQCESVV
jgi:GDP-D-mannose 3', 5'-epimerase